MTPLTSWPGDGRNTRDEAMPDDRSRRITSSDWVFQRVPAPATWAYFAPACHPRLNLLPGQIIWRVISNAAGRLGFSSAPRRKLSAGEQSPNERGLMW
jgi:hypothetical protein